MNLSSSFNYIGRIIVAILIFVVDQFLLLAMRMPQEALSIGYVAQIIIRLAVVGLVTYLIYRYYRYLLNKSNPRNFNQGKFGFDKVMLVFGMFFLLIALQVVINLIFLRNQPTAQNQVIIIDLVKRSNFLFGLFVVVVGPIIEEIIFRGLFFDLFFKQSSKLKNVLGVILNGLLFGLAHTKLQFNLSLISYAVMGMLFAGIYLKTKDIRCSTGVHMLNNLMSFIGIMLMK